jgi:serine protease Do
MRVLCTREQSRAGREREKMMRINKRTGVLALVLPAGLLMGALINSGLSAKNQVVAPDATPLEIPSPVQLSNSFSKLAKQLEPSVVQITSSIEEKSPRGRSGMPFDDDWFQQFFGPGNPFGGQMPQGPNRRQAPQARRSEVGGSGFIVDKNGYIITNNHVVENATRVRVLLHGDSSPYTAKVIGTDPELDLAVLKVDAGKPLPPVKIGNSDGVQVGDWAVAIGSPFGLDATVTAGIISAKGRDLADPDHQLQRFIQTDAAINPGNSGGPLLDINGNVIGVNTMIATRTGAFDGVGFALPINLAVKAYNQIIKTGKVSRGAIGILFQREQPAELLKAWGVNQGGVFVTQVNADGPAARAGVKPEDVIITFNGKPVKDGDELVSLVSETPVGSKVPITVLRDGKKVDLTLTVGDRNDIIAGNQTPSRDRGSRSEDDGAPVKFGLSVQNLSARDRQQIGFREAEGVEVTSVDPDSFADDLGIREGDIITSINRQPVNSVEDVRRIASTLKPGDAVGFRIMRNTGASGLPGQRGESSWQALYPAGTLPRP